MRQLAATIIYLSIIFIFLYPLSLSSQKENRAISVLAGFKLYGRTTEQVVDTNYIDYSNADIAPGLSLNLSYRLSPNTHFDTGVGINYRQIKYLVRHNILSPGTSLSTRRARLSGLSISVPLRLVFGTSYKNKDARNRFNGIFIGVNTRYNYFNLKDNRENLIDIVNNSLNNTITSSLIFGLKKLDKRINPHFEIELPFIKSQNKFTWDRQVFEKKVKETGINVGLNIRLQ